MERTRVLERDGLKVTVRKQKYGDRYNYRTLLRRFVPKVDDETSDDDADMLTIRANFCLVIAHSTVEGADLAVTVDDDEATFARAVDAFLELDSDFVDEWIQAVLVMTRPPEQADPNAIAPATESNS